MARPIKIVMIGGGSYAWTPNITKDILLTPALTNAQFVFYDINKKASDLTKAFVERLAPEIKVKPNIISTDNRAKAFADADYFIITISTGGLDAMEHDIAIPEKYGVYHTVGDTSGPGGWARTIRNFNVFVDLAKAMNQYAPGAMVLNYTNPMTCLTDVLARLCKGPVVGLCHGLFENLEFIKRYYKLADENEIAIQYAGLNHFFWATEVFARGKDVMADLDRKINKQGLGFTDLLRDSSPDPMGFKSNREVATELFRLTGVMPYLGDRHTCEFFSWYVTNKKNMEKYKILRTPVKARKKGNAWRRKDLERMAKGGKITEDHYFRASRETAADIINAHSQGKVFIDVGNVPNTGQITNLPAGTVVETAVRVDRNGFTPIGFGKLPPQVAALVEPWAHVFNMTVDACFRRDKKMALQALRIDPVCAHLNADQVNQMGEQLLSAHKKFVTLK